MYNTPKVVRPSLSGRVRIMERSCARLRATNKELRAALQGQADVIEDVNKELAEATVALFTAQVMGVGFGALALVLALSLVRVVAG